MPLDGVFLHLLTNEIAPAILGGRVDKIHQPARETMVIAMRAPGGNRKLLICASASNPRMHFTALPQDNPSSPPMFCMLMRKHLTSAKLVDVRQISLDRIVHFIFETVNELGDRVTLTLAVEIMGRHSNIILFDQNNQIIDSIKRVNDEMSRVRPILPGMHYTLVAARERLSIFTSTPAEIIARLRTTPELPLSKALLEALEGMSPLVCREIVHHATRGEDMPVSQLNEEWETRLKFFLARLSDQLSDGSDQPTMLVDTNGKPADFCYFDVHQYGLTRISRAYDSYNEMLDSFYSERDRVDRMHQRGADLLKLLVNISDRTARKLDAQREELKTSTGRERLKICGDLLSTNLHALVKGMERVSLANYYEPDSPMEEITLDLMLTPVQNVQKYYAAYRKADTAEKKLRELIGQGEGEMEYFDTVFDELARAATESELTAIRGELASQGYVRAVARKGQKEEKLPPIKYLSDDGFSILCGRNNLQNEKLTLKDSRNADVWLHTQKIPGSHVVVVTAGETPPPSTIEQAAVIAAYNSKARESGKVAVDYTEIRNVHKHPAGKPGLVLYEPYQTAIVTPDQALVERLRERAKGKQAR